MKVGDKVQVEGYKLTRIVTSVDNHGGGVWTKSPRYSTEVWSYFADVKPVGHIDPRVEAAV